MKSLFSKVSEEKHTKQILHLAKKIGRSERELGMIHSVLGLRSTNARDVMIPRVDVHAVNLNSEPDLERLLNNNSYSRVPVYDGDVDNILGILHTKDFYLEKIHHRNGKKIDLKKLISPAYFVPESKSLIPLLREMQVKHLHLVVVVDEYGGFSGIVTMEDIFEEIIGDIQDEFDTESDDIVQVDEKTFLIDARVPIAELPPIFSIQSKHTEIETIGGYVLSELGYIPKLHQNIVIAGVNFKIVEKRRNSILRIKVCAPSQKKEEKQESPSSEKFEENLKSD